MRDAIRALLAQLGADETLPPAPASPRIGARPFQPPRGIVRPGSVDPYQQPVVPNPDGTSSTVDTIGVNLDGLEYVLPTVTRDGRHFTGTEQEIADQAVREFRRTGQHLGAFDTVNNASEAAAQLHEEYAGGKYRQRGKR